MLQCDIDKTGKDVTVHASGSFEMIAVNIIQVIRAVYDQTKNAHPEAAEYFRDGLRAMVNNDKIWEIDTLGAHGKANASVVFIPVGGDESEHDP